MISEFDENFIKVFDELGATTLAQYSDSIEAYKKHIIPFEMKRMKENQNLSFKNTTLQKDKNELLSKIQQLTSQNKQSQYVMQTQQLKLMDLDRKIGQLQRMNDDNLSMIMALKMTNTELEESLNEKIQIIKQVEHDKSQVLQDMEVKKNDYNILLANYMKEKNSLVEKLNYMNQLQISLHEKDKQIKQQEFYLKKQWEQFEQAKKNANTPQMSVIPDRSFKKGNIPMNMGSGQKEDEMEKIKNQRVQILRNPIKKIYKHHNNEIYDISFNYNGSMIATCGGDRQIKVYDVLSGKAGINIASHSAQNIFISLCLDYGGEKILAGSTDKSVHIFSSSTGKELHSFVGHGYKINAVAWSCAKEKCVSGSDDKQIKVWEIEKAANSHSIQCGKSVKTVTCNSVQPIVYSGHSDGSVRIYSLSQGTSPISQVKGLIDYPINHISLLSNRNQVLVSSQQGYRIHLIDFKMNKSIAKYQSKDFFNTSVQADVSPSESYVVAGNCDGYLYYWDKAKGTFERKVSGHDSPVTTLKYHFMSGILASCDKDGSVILWQ